VSVIEPTFEQVVAFCAREPVERVFLEDVARRGLGHFAAVQDGNGELTALCHIGANLVPSGEGCGRFAELAAQGQSRMIIGAADAVGELWAAARHAMARPREDRPGQPVYVIEDPPAAGASGLRAASPEDLGLLLPVCAAAHELELGINPLERDTEGFRWRTLSQIEEGRSWLWVEDGVVLFKAEASAWTEQAVQVQQVWVDPGARGRGNGSRGLRDLCRLLLERTPAVTLFVRSENAPAIALYDSVGMRHVLDYRTILF